ncbi:hypothetical protein [Ruegeria atlantica]|uniref:hypothetical protein n=1 Tax=Ruegeria atlantica TaxID=81569 RepID=UPI00147CD01D|nr:hypothetical protein [Ruegeria atlantica]
MVRVLILTLTLMGFASGALPQRAAVVKFEQGNFGTMVNGAVTGNEYFDYKLGAKAGQKMFADLKVSDTNGYGVIYFNILPPGSDGVAIYNGSIDGNTARIELPEDGDYTIRVYLMGNDRDTDKTVGYNLDLSIQ